MNTLFNIFLLAGVFFALTLFAASLCMLFKRFHGKKTKIVIKGFGTIETAEAGYVCLFFGIALFAYASTLYYQKTQVREVSAHLANAMSTTAMYLRTSFNNVRHNKAGFSVNDFKVVDALLQHIQALDRDSGYSLYFGGEITRVRDQQRFTKESCPLPIEKQADWPAYQRDFYEYIELEKTLPKEETWGDTDWKSCYKTAKGFCRQRTAWIHHLLANDFYQKVLVETDPDRQQESWRRVCKHVLAVGRSFPEKFEQCTSTISLGEKAEKALGKPCSSFDKVS